MIGNALGLMDIDAYKEYIRLNYTGSQFRLLPTDTHPMAPISDARLRHIASQHLACSASVPSLDSLLHLIGDFAAPMPMRDHAVRRVQELYTSEILTPCFPLTRDEVIMILRSSLSTRDMLYWAFDWLQSQIFEKDSIYQERIRTRRPPAKLQYLIFDKFGILEGAPKQAISEYKEYRKRCRYLPGADLSNIVS